MKLQLQPQRLCIVSVCHETRPTFEPVGALCMVGFLRSLGYAATLECLSYYHGNLGRLADRILDGRYDLVGLSSVTSLTMERTLELAGALRRRGYRGCMLGGGIHPTLNYPSYLQNGGLDAVVLGDGEPAMQQLLPRLESGVDLHDLPGFAFPGPDGGPVVTSPGVRVTDLDRQALLPPDYRDHLAKIFRPKDLQGVIPSSRGCYGNCTYCLTPGYLNANRGGPRHRTASSTRIVEVMRRLHDEYGIRRFNLMGDCIFSRGEAGIAQMSQLADALSDPGPSLEFSLLLRADFDGPRAAGKQISRLIQRGLKSVFVGIESFEDKDLAFYRKAIDSASMAKFLAVLQERGFRCDAGADLRLKCGLILFHPDTELAAISRHIAIARQLQLPPKRFLRKLLFFDHTAIAEHYAKQGYCVADCSADYEFKSRRVGVFHEFGRRFVKEIYECRERVRALAKTLRGLSLPVTLLGNLRDYANKIDVACYEFFDDLARNIEIGDPGLAAEKCLADHTRRLAAQMPAAPVAQRIDEVWEEARRLGDRIYRESGRPGLPFDDPFDYRAIWFPFY